MCMDSFMYRGRGNGKSFRNDRSLPAMFEDNHLSTLSSQKHGGVGSPRPLGRLWGPTRVRGQISIAALLFR